MTADDHAFMDALDELQRPFHVIMTKARGEPPHPPPSSLHSPPPSHGQADLLPPAELAASNVLVRADASRHESYAGGDVPMCSSRSGAGVQELWGRLKLGVELTAAGVDLAALEAGGGRRGRGGGEVEEEAREEAEGEPPGAKRRRRVRRRRGGVGHSEGERAAS